VIVHCSICTVQILLGDRRKGELLYYYISKTPMRFRQQGPEGRKREQLLDLGPGSCNEPITCTEDDEVEDATSVSEYKVIFIVACNMADPTDKICYYSEDCLDEFLKFILQDKKFKDTTFIAHNASPSSACPRAQGESGVPRPYAPSGFDRGLLRPQSCQGVQLAVDRAAQSQADEVEARRIYSEDQPINPYGDVENNS
jgi:hypothetical protein